MRLGLEIACQTAGCFSDGPCLEHGRLGSRHACVLAGPALMQSIQSMGIDPAQLAGLLTKHDGSGPDLMYLRDSLGLPQVCFSECRGG